MRTLRNVVGAFLVASLSLAPLSQSAFAKTHHKHHMSRKTSHTLMMKKRTRTTKHTATKTTDYENPQ